ncbi:MAG TPA: acyl-CoA thioesterase [Crenotrichaceae bacterium]|nr:acyl-CoA thioesterase [Crenotrichaceae bacterium]
MFSVIEAGQSRQTQHSGVTVDRLSAEVEILVPFYDIDMLGIAWHGHYAKYFEIARCALLDKIDYGYMKMQESGYIWPIIDLQVRYVAALTFDQEIRVYAELAEYEYRLTIKYRITDAQSGQRIAKGQTIQVAVDSSTKEMCYASPSVLTEKLDSFSG